jgi:hypothetical protein
MKRDRERSGVGVGEMEVTVERNGYVAVAE